MSQEKLGVISNSIISGLKKLETAHQKDTPKETIVNELAHITINAAVNSTQRSAELSGDSHLIEDIQAKGETIYQSIVDNDGGQGVFKELGKAVKKLLLNVVHSLGLRFGHRQADSTSRVNIAGFFKDRLDRSPTVRVLSALGKIIGEKFPIPMGSVIGESLGCLVATVTESLVNAFGLSNSYKNLIRESEFSKENLQVLCDYGVKEKQFALLTERFAEDCRNLNIVFDLKVKESEDASKEMHSAIEKI